MWSLKTRWLLGIGVAGALMATAWVVQVDHSGSAKHDAALRAHLETAARGLAAGVDGDALGTGELAGASQDQTRWIARSMGTEEMFQVLRTPPSLLQRLSEQPDLEPFGDLEVVFSGEEQDQPGTVQCTAAWKPLFQPQIGVEERPTLVTVGVGGPNEVVAYAPVTDSWGQATGIVRVAAVEGQRSLLQHALSLVLWSLVAGSVLGLALWGANTALRAHCTSLRLLSEGRPEEALGRFPSHEMRHLTSTVETLLASVLESNRPSDGPLAPAQQAQTAATLAQRPQAEPAALNGSTALQAPRAAQRAIQAERLALFGGGGRSSGGTGLATRVYSPKDLVQQAVAGSSSKARRRALELRITVGDQVPPSVQAEEEGMREALQLLLDRAILNTREGTVHVRVNKVPGSSILRVEVNDTGLGVPWDDQAALRDELQAAHDGGGTGNLEGLARASALAAEMNGKLDFESQPGSGSRFWFTVNYQPV